MIKKYECFRCGSEINENTYAIMCSNPGWNIFYVGCISCFPNYDKMPPWFSRKDAAWEQFKWNLDSVSDCMLTKANFDFAYQAMNEFQHKLFESCHGKLTPQWKVNEDDPKLKALAAAMRRDDFKVIKGS